MFSNRKPTEEEKTNIRTNVGKLINTDLNSIHIKIKPPLIEQQPDLWHNRIRRDNSDINDKENSDINERVTKIVSKHYSLSEQNISEKRLCGIKLWIFSICN